MQNFKFVMSLFIALVALLLVGYWAIATIEPGSAHVDKQKQKQLEDRNKELSKEVEKLKNELRALQAEENSEQVAGVPKVEEFDSITKPAPSNLKHQNLINELEKLIADKVVMKEKSRGTRVGTVQIFLNIYNGTSKKVDNDYGKGTKLDVANFQKAVGLAADGEAGATTFQKMIDWLKQQG